MNYKRILFYFLICSFFIVSCKEEEAPLPKPRMYPKVTFPEYDYNQFDESYCDLTFEYPDYGKIIQDRKFFEEESEDPCWFNIQFEDFKGTFYASYISIDDRQHFDKLVQDAYTMANEHNRKANYRREELIQNQHGVSGLYFDIGGDVATNMQFLLTDTTNHFFRGSLYFNAKVNRDSIDPIFTFIKNDIDHLINTFQWTE